LAIRAAPEIRFVIPRQLRIALRELSPIASLCDRSHAVLGPRKCLVETNPPRPTRLRRSKRRVRCNRESSWRWPMQTGCPFTSSSSPLRHFLYGIMQMSWHRRTCNRPGWMFKPAPPRSVPRISRPGIAICNGRGGRVGGKIARAARARLLDALPSLRPVWCRNFPALKSAGGLAGGRLAIVTHL
jgi:hypothetical protein